MAIRSNYSIMTALFLSCGVLVAVLAAFSVSAVIWLPLLVAYAALGVSVRCPGCGYPIAYVPDGAELAVAPKQCTCCGRLTKLR